MIVDELSHELAALIAVAALAMIGIAFAVLRLYWHRFEYHYKKLPKHAWKPTYRVGIALVLWSTLVMLVYGFLSIQEFSCVPDISIPLTFGSFALLVFVFLIDFGIRRKITKKIVINPDMITLYYFIALLWMVSSLFFNIIALVGVAPAMLLITFGPFDYTSFIWARWFMASAITNFSLGILVFGAVFYMDKIIRRIKKLPEDNHK